MNPEHTYITDGEFQVTLTVSSGPPDSCVDVYTFTITTFRPSSIFIPNVATPNDDGQNDYFTVKSESLQLEQMTIYNRWGRKVFEWSEVGGKWDCKKENGGTMADGTYFFVFYARGNDGVEYNENGTLTILK
jgi:gliding motility-associated-like protein